MGDPIINLEEMLFRQIHPNCIVDGAPASDRFKPQPADAGFMSVDRSSITSAASSHALYVSTGRKSSAVYGVTVGEFKEEEIQCLSDPLSETVSSSANDAHALADYNPHDEKKWKLISKRLTQKARAHGQLHP